MCDISIREYIRWLPDAPGEPTTTIVLTTPERRFVDLRILNPTSPENATGESAGFLASEGAVMLRPAKTSRFRCPA
jgi:hypothetical protein